MKKKSSKNDQTLSWCRLSNGHRVPFTKYNGLTYKQAE